MEIISIDQEYTNKCGCCGLLCDSKSPNFLGECIECNTIACKNCYQTGTWNCDIGCRECCGKCDDCIKFYKEILDIDKQKPQYMSKWFINEVKTIMKETKIYVINLLNNIDKNIELMKEIDFMVEWHNQITDVHIINNSFCRDSYCEYNCESCYDYNIIITNCIEIIDGIERIFGNKKEKIYRSILQELKVVYKQKRINKKKCSFCKLYDKKNKKCGRCLVCYYCNINCQKTHWKIHKKTCMR